MKKERYKYYCKIQPDGRLYSGGWAYEGIIPNTLPEGYLVLDEFPDESDGSDYIFQNGEFVYSPQSTTTEDKTEEEEVTYQ